MNVRSRRKKVVEPESDDSDEDWTPATERRKSNRENKPVTYFNMPKDRQPRVRKRTAKRSSTATNDSKPKKKKVAVEAHTYPLRKLQETNYMDLEVPDDDHFLYCEECNKEFDGDCPIHGPLITFEDKQIMKVPEVLSYASNGKKALRLHAEDAQHRKNVRLVKSNELLRVQNPVLQRKKHVRHPFPTKWRNCGVSLQLF
ncbi:hypothetical protein ScPMuIL_002921 [Solemya velum]